jgi:WD40 repeat protein
MPVPPCLFAGQPVPAEPGPPFEAYRFSEPRVVLTHPSAIGIAGWLPDGQQLLITRDIPDTNRNSIDLFNVRTGELNTYAERDGSSGKPVWLPALRAVAYITLVAEKGQEPPIVYHPELWISYGNPQQVERLTSDIRGALAVEPGGKRLWYFSRSEPDRPQVFDGESRVIQTAPWNVAAWKYPKPDLEWAMRDRSPQFTMVWHPDGTRVVLYSQFWTFLLDVKTTQVCELTLGEYNPEAMDIPPWPLEAQWSPDGRYLAFITTDSLNLPLRRTELAILDMETGERRTLSPGPDIEPGQHYVYDIAWVANSQQLIALAQTETSWGRPIQKLYLIDARTGDSQQIMPDIFGGGTIEGWQLAWSPNGQTLAVKCPTWLETEPTIVEDHICLISVTLQP